MWWGVSALALFIAIWPLSLAWSSARTEDGKVAAFGALVAAVILMVVFSFMCASAQAD